ncbi:MAG TPA: GNAT family N-acetyltransferase [Actinomycetota bacterium]|nr:GNAT family N-acetyltransferase [Actinomycetota bacterium]
MKLVLHDPQDARGLQREILHVYENAWAPTRFSPTRDQLSDFSAIFGRHLTQKGFRLVGAHDDAGELGGFAYGYRSVPGGWWRDMVTSTLHGDLVERWFSDGFEFVELAVDPRVQGQGIGSALHDALLEDVQQRTALLSTQSDNAVALRLYRRRRWIVLDPSFMFPNRSYAYTIMGLDLERARQQSAPSGAGRDKTA